jgi:hypothetical protein
MKIFDTKNAAIASSSITVQTLTLNGDGYAVGADVECRWAIIKVSATTYLGDASDVAATDFPLASTDLPLKVQVANTELLHFKGSAGQYVYLISGS